MPSIHSLPKRKQKYVRERLKGVAKTAAAIAAGYAPTTAQNVATRVETDDVKAVFQSMVQAACPPPSLVKILKDGLSAEKTEFFTKDGLVTDKRNTVAWSERRAYLELAAEYAGYVPKDQQPAQHLHLLAMMPEPVAPGAQGAQGGATSQAIDTTSEVIPDAPK